MIKNKLNTIKFLFLAVFLLFLSNCSFLKDEKKEENSSLPKKDVELDAQVRAKKFAEKGGGILGDFTKRGGGTTYNFGTSNVMWKASIKTLKFMPLQSVDYGGGVLVTDWYAPENSGSSRESVKISIRFLSDKVSANSFEIVSHKKLCDKSLVDCKIVPMSNSFNEQLKNKIMQEVSVLLIEEKKIKE